MIPAKQRVDRDSQIYVLLLALAGIFGYLLKVTGVFSDVPGDLGDARFNSVVLEHFYLWVTGKAHSLWSPTFFFPYPNVLAFSDNHFGTAWLYSIFRLLGLSRESAYDVWFWLGSLSTYAASVYAARKLGLSWLGAAVSGFVFAYSMPVLAQGGHAQLSYRLGVPLAALEMWRVLDGRERSRLAYVGIWTAIQFFCSIYIGLFLVFLLSAMAIASLWSIPRQALLGASVPTDNKRRNKFAWLAAGILWILLLAMLKKYRSVSAQYGFVRNKEEILSMLPRPSSYLVADPSRLSSWVGAWNTGIPMRHEHQMFFGIGVLLLFLVGLIACLRNPAWRRHALIFVSALGIMFLLCVSVHGISIYRYLMSLPGFNSIRAVTRICLVMAFPVGLIAGSGAAAMRRRFGSFGPAGSLLVLILVSLETFYYLPSHVSIQSWRDRISELRNQWAPPKSVTNPILFVTAKDGDLWIHREIDGMILGQDLNVPTLNGYSGNAVPGFTGQLNCAEVLRQLGEYELRWPKSNYADLAQRVVTVPNLSCATHATDVPLRGPIPDQLFKATSLRLVSVKRNIHNYTITIEIHNAGNSYLPALSSTTQPIQFSWQYVGEGQNPDPANWLTRTPLDVDVPAGGNLIQALTIPLPDKPGQDKLVVTLVQDNVAWFQDLGMRMLTLNPDIPDGTRN